jgi:hypothetical protein
MTDNADGATLPAASLITKYESLRGAALGAALPPEARSGLALFLRRGMWSWTRALATANVSSRQATWPTSSSSTAPHERKAVIQLFAAMAMNPDKRGAS